MAWHRTGAKPLLEPMLIQSTNAYVSPVFNIIKHVEPCNPFNWQFFHYNSNSMEISFCSPPNFSPVIARKFCTRHYKWAIVSDAKMSSDLMMISNRTRTTRTPAFWGYPPAASWLPIVLSHIGSQVKRRQSQSYKFKEFAKISNFLILKQTLHVTHLLKLLDKMCKYQMDSTSIVEDTGRTRLCPQTDRRTRWNQYTPFQLRWSGRYNYRNVNYWFNFNLQQQKLEELERLSVLRIPPLPHYYPNYWVILDPKWKQDSKFQNFEINFTCDTPS